MNIQHVIELRQRIRKAKDALGHGSDARGLAMGAMRASVGQYKRIMAQPKTAGLHIEATRVGAYRYPKVVHTMSGKTAASFTHEPLQGSYRDFAALVDKHLGGIDWNRSEGEVLADPKPAAAAVSNLMTEVNERNRKPY